MNKKEKKEVVKILKELEGALREHDPANDLWGCINSVNDAIAIVEGSGNE